MDIIILSTIRVVESLPMFGIMLLGLYLSKLFFDLTTSYKFNTELTVKDNPAFGVSLAGYLAGTGIAFGGIFQAAESTLQAEWIYILIDVIVVILLMRLSVVVNDLLILHSFKIHDEITEDKNLGTGFVVAGSTLATGLMLNGVLGGESASFGVAFRDIFIYWLLGQLLLIIGGLVFQAITSYDIHKSIGDEDNAAAGISFGGFLASMGIIVRNALHGATSSLIEETIITVIFAVSGIILLALTRTIVDKILLPASPLSKEVAEQKNTAAGAVAATSFIVTALIFVNAVSPV